MRSPSSGFHNSNAAPRSSQKDRAGVGVTSNLRAGTGRDTESWVSEPTQLGPPEPGQVGRAADFPGPGVSDDVVSLFVN